MKNFRFDFCPSPPETSYKFATKIDIINKRASFDTFYLQEIIEKVRKMKLEK